MREKTGVLKLRWLIPIAVLVIMVSSLLIDYVLETKNSSLIQVEKDIYGESEVISLKISGMMDKAAGATDVAGALLETRGTANAGLIVNTVAAIASSCDAHMAAYCGLEGNAFLSSGARISLKDTDYYENLQGDTPFFAYTERGVEGEAALLYVRPVIWQEEVQGYLIAYLTEELVLQTLREGIADESTFHILLDENGMLLTSLAAVQGTTLVQENFWEALSGKEEVAGQWNYYHRQISRDMTAGIYVDDGGTERFLVHTAIESGNWQLITLMDRNYIQKRHDRVWADSRKFLLFLSFTVFTFLLSIGIVAFITRRRDRERHMELQNKVDTDLLTDLYNKVATERKIREYIQDNPDKQGLLFIIDVDNFKKINDTMGHAFGDEVLCNLGIRLRGWFRISDIVGRTGGDEFMVFVKDIQDKDRAMVEGKRLEEFFRSFEVGEYVKYSATASVGGALFPKDGTSFEELYRAADAALYHAKRQGKNRIFFYRREKSI